MRRLAMALVTAAVAVAAGWTGDARAGAPPTDELPTVDVVEVSGLLDEVVEDEISQALERAATDQSEAVVLQLNSKGGVISDERVAEIARAIQASPVPVAIWVGPSGARAFGSAGQLMGAAVVTGMAPGTRAGDFGDPLPGVELDLGSAAERLRTETIGADEALATGLVRIPGADQGIPVLRNMLLALDGIEYQGQAIDTADEVVGPSGAVQQELTVQPRFFKLALLPRLMHTVASPAVTYLLLTLGLGLLVFELFTAGVGLAGVVGAVCVVLGCYGLAVLPTNWWAATLFFLAFVALAIDVQTGVPRAWTTIGLALYIVASFFLFPSWLRPSWVTLLAGIAGTAAAFVVGMPSMVRTRFATPTIGRDWMIGEMGAAVQAVAPEGVVQVRGATWRARTNRATPIPAGGSVRVVGIDGFTLEVEPEEGGARDYRERGSA